ncbi:hypothetical protein SLEP1_g17882 [Rubroshorea leprosula]|uniref:Uncharacterized protein n=1 Tax=Rubroshorea leprosula TaxID=152421 RepID=A0AAV5J693_9ROSI|nr:hypothetical protein SLEP1_g17882 [Rubroshorea leprosula]
MKNLNQSKSSKSVGKNLAVVGFMIGWEEPTGCEPNISVGKNPICWICDPTSWEEPISCWVPRFVGFKNQVEVEREKEREEERGKGRGKRGKKNKNGTQLGS